MKKLSWTLVVLFMLAEVASGAEDGGFQAVVQYIRGEAERITEACLTSVHSLADWERERPKVRSQLLYMLGLDPMPERTPLQARTTGVVQADEYRIEKIVFQSSPGLYVTGNLYIPNQGEGPFPAVLYVCGHYPHPFGAKVYYQERAAWFALNGFAAFILDTLEFGEVPGIHHGLHDLDMYFWLSLGYTPIGTEVWNAMRAIDYLETREEINSEAIGITGISGGGSTSWYAAAVDERIKAAAPVCSTYTFASQARHWRAFGQCDCIYFHNTFLQDFPIVGALIAPRALAFMSGKRDGDFPPDGHQTVYEKVKRIYDLYEVGDSHLKAVSDDVGHTDSPLFQKEARQWMKRWLRDDLSPYEEGQVKLREPQELAVLDGVLPADAVNYDIHRRLTAGEPPSAPSNIEEWNERRRFLLSELKEKTFGWFPDETPAFESSLRDFDGAWVPLYADFQDFEFTSEPGIRIRAQLLKPPGAGNDNPVLIFVKRPEDSVYFADFDELLPVLGRYTVVLLNSRLTQQSLSATEFRDLQMSSAWIGRSIESMQVWDILRTIDWLQRDQGLRPSSLALYGKGSMGLIALYAALFNESVSQVILNEPPLSHWAGPAFFNVLRFTDLAETAGLLAPRRLTLLSSNEPSPVTKSIYKLYGEEVERSNSLAEAMRVWERPRQ
ncbi:MAG TPA: CocE/NonD family hydrolase [Acidobacteriota bacterium]|nr:CocE/NonD family hydrolase [Acidobacteriota bacterium]